LNIRPRVSTPTGTVGGVHRDAADGGVANLLLDFEDDGILTVARHFERLQDLGQIAGRELDVDDGADDLGDLALHLG
jgi:hypothetical protein